MNSPHHAIPPLITAALCASLMLACTNIPPPPTATSNADLADVGSDNTAPDPNNTAPAPNNTAPEPDVGAPDPTDGGNAMMGDVEESCVNRCSDRAGATTSCINDECAYECNAGFADLNDDLANPVGDGCESDCVPSNQPESICDGVDDDCDGSFDENYTTNVTCGMGACAADQRCVRGEELCEPGTNSPDNNCDGIDNDCDGTMDEGFIPGICGVGACTSSALCDNGQEHCTPGPPEANDDTFCDGVDEDCDSEIDEDYTPSTCGVGACLAEATCANARERCSPGEPTDEVCGDGVDNDCNGATDDDGACRPAISDLTACQATADEHTLRVVEGWRRDDGDATCKAAFGDDWWWGPDLIRATPELRASTLTSFMANSPLTCTPAGGEADSVYLYWVADYDEAGEFSHRNLGLGNTDLMAYWGSVGCPTSMDTAACNATFCDDYSACGGSCPTTKVLCCR